MPIFVIQEHHAKKLHWDFRLESGGVLKSWAIPKGPSMDPSQKRLAIQVPDHDKEHASYEGIIPEMMYGSGPVLIWDQGEFEPKAGTDFEAALKKGHIGFTLRGQKLKGEFTLLRLKDGKNWLLMKKNDAHAKAGWETEVLLTPKRKANLPTKMPACAIKE
jgi:bifunctional non-homologous end joining protein LigD